VHQPFGGALALSTALESSLQRTVLHPKPALRRDQRVLSAAIRMVQLRPLQKRRQGWQEGWKRSSAKLNLWLTISRERETRWTLLKAEWVAMPVPSVLAEIQACCKFSYLSVFSNQAKRKQVRVTRLLHSAHLGLWWGFLSTWWVCEMYEVSLIPHLCCG